MSSRTGVATEGGYFGPGSGMVLLDNVRCQGTERSLSHCRNDGWGISNCEHPEDVGVICDAPPTTIATTTSSQGSGIDFFKQNLTLRWNKKNNIKSKRVFDYFILQNSRWWSDHSLG